jgi:hypothetical protein
MAYQRLLLEECHKLLEIYFFAGVLKGPLRGEKGVQPC